MDFWVNKPPDDPAPSFHINPNHWVFPAKAPDIEKQWEAEASCPYYTLFELLTHRIPEQKEMVF